MNIVYRNPFWYWNKCRVKIILLRNTFIKAKIIANRRNPKVKRPERKDRIPSVDAKEEFENSIIAKIVIGTIKRNHGIRVHS
jgi:hypothetical protein